MTWRRLRRRASSPPVLARSSPARARAHVRLPRRYAWAAQRAGGASLSPLLESNQPDFYDSQSHPMPPILLCRLYPTLPCPTLVCPTLLCSTLPYSTSPYSTLLYSTLLYSTLLCSTLLYSTLLYSTLLYSTLLYSTLLYSNPMESNQIYSTLLHSTLLCSTLLGADQEHRCRCLTRHARAAASC